MHYISHFLRIINNEFKTFFYYEVVSSEKEAYSSEIAWRLEYMNHDSDEHEIYISASPFSI